MPIDSKTQVYGIFGQPMHHLRSPLIHNSQFKRLEMNAVYLTFEVAPDLLGLAFESVRTLGIRGVNVTIPHKEAALNFIDEVPEDVDRCVGAINTVVNRDGKLYGYNTDVNGFLMALKEELSFNPAGKTALVLGAGGAARGAVTALARAGAERVLVSNRTFERAKGLTDYVTGFFPETDLEAVEDVASLSHEKIDLVVNATSLGMQKKDELPINLKVLAKPACAVDMVYGPVLTPFLENAKSLGWAFTNGTGMLAAQAALSFELWTGQKEGVREGMLKVLRQCHL